MNPPDPDRTAPDLIVIPARFGSTRLPGKPLLALAGRTLLERVVANARRAADLARHCEVVVATDDDRIIDHARMLGVRAIMTDPALTSGSARAHAAALTMSGGGDAPERIINIQGDAPFIPPDTIAALIETLRQGTASLSARLGPARPIARAQKRRALFRHHVRARRAGAGSVVFQADPSCDAR